jgi:hypothetical protein
MKRAAPKILERSRSLKTKKNGEKKTIDLMKAFDELAEKAKLETRKRGR